MMATQRAYGRDRESATHAGAISLGHQSLEITPEDRFESQPLLLGEARLSVEQQTLMVADARILNRAALAQVLDIPYDEAAAMPDSAFIRKSWERWGQSCTDHLAGAFSFAVWDGEAQSLFLARDHAGERTLYYCATPEWFAFATTARALLECPGTSSELDEVTLARDSVGLPPLPARTFYRDIRQLDPGHAMLVHRDGPETQPRRYWHYDQLPEIRYARDSDYVDAFLEIFGEAVRCRLHTSARIGTQLSAGLDSGAVTAMAAGLMAPDNKRITAYTSVPRSNFSGLTGPNQIADEGPYAAALAAMYPNIDHALVDSSGSDAMCEMERVFPLLERPVSAPLNQVWLDLILDDARDRGINVMLTGMQGNRTISYSGNDVIGRLFHSGRWVKSLRMAYVLRRNGMSSGRDAASQTLFSLLPWRLRSRLDPMINTMTLDDTALRPEMARELRLVEELGRYSFLSETRLPSMMQTIFHGKGVGYFNGMAGAGWGIELRDPTADKRVFEFCASIPLEQYVAGGSGRSLIRRAMRGRMPDATLDRRIRGTQTADWYESLTPIHPQLVAEAKLLETSPGTRKLLDVERIRRTVEHWPKTAKDANEQALLYRMWLPDAIATGYFMRRTEQIGAMKSNQAST
jgi:asparagine synthase (glutamine-hydrolysing)